MDGYSFQAQLNRISPVGLVSGGLRIDIGFAGNITAGKLMGSSIEGVDYLLIRPDGVGVLDARELIAASDGSRVGAHAEGYVVAPFAMPELSTLMDPGFTWPDIELPRHGSVWLQSGSPGFEAMNRRVYSFTGTVNMARGSLTESARPITNDGYAEAVHVRRFRDGKMVKVSDHDADGVAVDEFWTAT